jgi:hypothetical protein
MYMICLQSLSFRGLIDWHFFLLFRLSFFCGLLDLLFFLFIVLLFLISLLLLLLLLLTLLLLLLALLLFFLFVVFLLLLGFLLFSQEGILRGRVLDQETMSLHKVLLNRSHILDVFVPTEQIVVLKFLLISHLEQIIVELGEHVKICECEVASHKEGPALKMFLEVFAKFFPLFELGLDLGYFN